MINQPFILKNIYLHFRMKQINSEAKDGKDFFHKYRDEAVFSDIKSVTEVFSHFDKNKYDKTQF